MVFMKMVYPNQITRGEFKVEAHELPPNFVSSTNLEASSSYSTIDDRGTFFDLPNLCFKE